MKQAANPELTSRKEFWPLLAEYQKLTIQSPSDQRVKELSKQINQFLEIYTAKLVSGAASATRKAAFLLKFDSLMNAHGFVPQQRYYAEYGASHITSFLKLSFYKNSFTNYDEVLKGRLDYSNEEMLKKLNELPVEDRANRIIENIVEEVFQSVSNKEMFQSICDWMIDELRLTSRIIRIVEIFSRIIPSLTHKRGKFLQSFLYIFGGIVKEETLSYLKTVLNSEEYRMIEQYIGQEEQKFIKELDKEEVQVFEKHIPEAVTRFFAALLAPSPMIKALNSNNEESFCKLISQQNEGEYEKECTERAEEVNLIEAAHYSFMFGFDTLAFYFCFLTKHSTKQAVDKESIKKMLEESKHPKFNRNYILSGSETLINITFKMLLEICGDPITLMRLCTRRLADTVPRKYEGERMYNRVAPYNIVGAALYIYLVLYEHKKGKENLLPIILTNEHIFELYLPFINGLFQLPMTVIFGIELLHTFFVEEKVNLKEYKLNSNSFIDKLRTLLESIAKSTERTDGTMQYMQHIMFSKVIESIPIKSLMLIIEKLIPKLETDKTKAMTVESLKTELIKVKDKEIAHMVKAVIGEFFSDHIDMKESQLVMLNTIKTVKEFLELYKSLILNEVYEIKDDKEFQEILNKYLIEPIKVLLKVVLDEEQNEDKKIPDTILNEYRKEKVHFEALRSAVNEIESALSSTKLPHSSS